MHAAVNGLRRVVVPLDLGRRVTPPRSGDRRLDRPSHQLPVPHPERERVLPHGTGGRQGFAAFGRVVSGMDVVNKIKGVQTGRSGMHGDVPVVPVVINSATLLP